MNRYCLKLLSLLLLFTINCLPAHAQRKERLVAAKATLLSPLEQQYDLHYTRLDVAMNNTSTAVSGMALLKARVTVASLAEFAFELDSLLTIDSLQIEGNSFSGITRSGSLVIASLTVPATLDQNLTVSVYYHGATPSGTGFFTRGLVVDNHYMGHSITYSLSDRFLAKDWWPCKQDINDKIDSADLWITVPDTLQVASNGILKNITDVAPGYKRFEWQTRYPTAYYLLSVAIMPYQVYTQQAFFAGDSMPVVHYIPDNPGLLETLQPELDSTGMVISYFSELFGRYPFWNEKYGQALAPLGGGMEHQTISTVGIINTTLMAHELCHQWWGDGSTFNSWADIWLSEGFASYGEHLFLEHFYTAGAAKNWRNTAIIGAISEPGGSVFVDDTSTDDRVFDGRLTYNKGGAVVHMLRYLVNNDFLFFAGLRQYLEAHAYANAGTADLQAAMESTTGLDLDTFFNQWIYGEGYPRFNAKWNQDGSTVYLELTQTASKPSSISLFHLPLEVKLKSPEGDTIVRIYNNSPVQLYAFDWARPMNGLQLDPEKNMLCRQLSVVHQEGLQVTSGKAGSLRLAGNPADTQWQLLGLERPATLQLTDLQGRLLQEVNAATGHTTISAQSLPAGSYLLGVKEQGRAPVYFRLLKR